ncbi:MAG TPA: magnesium/cobalt transporter CorA [Anaerolineae bacterium]|nr:magnesium/cobalt transporter CorA [Anaerolineae bacterium]
MVRVVKRRSEKAGLPPGTLVHIGEKKVEKPTITVIEYDEMNFQEKEVDTIEDCFPYKEKEAVTWINVEGIHRVEILEKIGDCFGLHPLVLEDILNTNQRPKLEDYVEYIYIVLKMLYYDGKRDGITVEQVSLILGPNYVLSFQEGIAGDIFDPMRAQIRNAKGRIRKMGADYLAYTLIDSVVDNYFVIIEELGEDIELLEEDLVTDPRPETLTGVQKLKREMIFLRRSVWPLREVIGTLERRESPLVKESTGLYLRDVYDHTIQVIDTIETFRDMLSGMLDIYLSSISNRLNEVVKVLTIISTIFIPVTFITGAYGMNFRYMPELQYRYGYPLVWLVIVIIAALMLLYFRRRKWI